MECGYAAYLAAWRPGSEFSGSSGSPLLVGEAGMVGLSHAVEVQGYRTLSLAKDALKPTLPSPSGCALESPAEERQPAERRPEVSNQGARMLRRRSFGGRKCLVHAPAGNHSAGYGRGYWIWLHPRRFRGCDYPNGGEFLNPRNRRGGWSLLRYQAQA